MASNAYSFVDVQAAIVGPNGAVSVGPGAGNAEEGISISMMDDKGAMIAGADGHVMHSLHASKAGTITVRLLKTSPVNAILSLMYNADTISAAVYGNNTIVIRDSVRGDVVAASGCAFRKHTDVSYAKSGNIHEWTFNCAKIDFLLGVGTPARIL